MGEFLVCPECKKGTRIKRSNPDPEIWPLELTAKARDRLGRLKAKF